MTKEKVLNIPMVDLKAQYATIKNEVQEAVLQVIDSQYFILGPEVEALEKSLAEYCQTQHALGVSSGTDALILALMSLGIGPGDEVITTPFTFFATAGSIFRVGARPVFVDISADDFNLDPDQVAGVVTENTRAVMPVHLYGQCADVDAIQKAVGDEIPIIEDSAQAIGATYHGRRAGSLGKVGCFSFYPSKNLGGMAEGGLCTTNDEELATTMGLLRNHGSSKTYHHEMVGGNFRLGAMNAAGLRVKFKYLDQWLEARRKNAALYDEHFKRFGLVGEKVTLPIIKEYNHHVFHQYVIQVEQRDELKDFLGRRGISSCIFYPIPLHLQPCFKNLGYSEGDLPVAEKMAKTVLALPMYAELEQGHIAAIVEAIAEFYGQ